MRKIVVFFIDALGTRLLTEDNAPFIYSLKKKGQYCAMNGIMGYSAAIHPSIWCSVYPEEHCKWVDIEKLARPRRKTIKEALLGLFPLFASKPINYFLHYSKFSRSKLLPSVPVNIANYFSKGGFDFKVALKKFNGIDTLFSYVKTDYHYELFVKDVKVRVNKGSELDVYFVGELDHASHLHLNTPTVMKGLLRRIDKKAKEIYDAYSKAYKEFDFIVMSDHGQDVIKKRVDIKREINKLKLKLIKDYLCCYDSTMARFWAKNSRIKEKITNKLKMNKGGKILDKNELKRWHLDFKDNKYGDIIFLLEPGYEIYPNFYHNYFKNNVEGMHGYTPESEGMKAVFVYNGKAKMNFGKASLLDIAPTVLALLGKGKGRGMKGSALCKIRK